MTTLETESGKQIKIPKTWGNLAELLQSDDLSDREKQKLIFAFYMNSRLSERAEAKNE